MYSKVKYLLVFVLVVGFCHGYAQQSETTEPAQGGVAKDIQYAKEKGEQIQNKVFTRNDSLSNKSADILQTTTDSLNNLSEVIEGKLQSNPPLLNSFGGHVDSLQQRLNEIQSSFAEKLRRTRKGNQQLSNVTEKADKLTRRIDSLQNVLSNKLRLDKHNDHRVTLPGMNRLEKVRALRVKGMTMYQQGDLPLKLDKLGNVSGDLVNSRPCAGISSLLGGAIVEKLDEQIRGFKGTGGRLRQMESSQRGKEIDQLIDSKAAQMSEFQTLNNETKELAAMPPYGWSPAGGKELPESMLADLKRYQDAQAMKAEAKEVAIKKATDYFANHQDKLSQAQGMMSKLKKKYSCVPDSRDLSTAIKASSLKGEPLKRRLIFGLGFQIQRTNPISIDLSPNLLYRFNKLFSAGISGTYRASLGIENNSAVAVSTSTDVYGASAIVQHKIWKGFFGHGEFQYLSTPITYPSPATDLPTRSWHEGLLLGIGKQMSFSKALKGQIIFTYDLLHNEHSPNPKAWNIKFGFMLGRFKLKDLQI